MIRFVEVVAGMVILVAAYVAFDTYFIPAREVTLGTPAYAVADGAPEGVSAQSWLLFDVLTGEVLSEQDAARTRPIASVTKLLTADLVLEEMDLNATTTISTQAVQTEGRAGSLKVGESMSVRELLFPLLLESSNDAAVVLAETYGEERFVHAMNDRAALLGMASASYQDPSGLDARSQASARDLQSLLTHIYRNDRYLLDITTLGSYAGIHHDWKNNNPARNEEGYQGGKHGFTDEAGRTFAGIFMETLGDAERPIGIILLDSKNINADVRALREYVHASVAYTYAF